MFTDLGHVSILDLLSASDLLAKRRQEERGLGEFPVMFMSCLSLLCSDCTHG